LNRNLLLHPEIKAGSGSNETSRQNENSAEVNDGIENMIPLLLNTTDGVSGMCFQMLLQHCMRNGGIERNQDNLRRGESMQETYLKAKRMSSTVMIRRGVHEINDAEVVDLIKGNRDKLKEREVRAVRKKRNQLRTRIEAINRLRLTIPDIAEWNLKDFKEFIQYKKQKGDPKMPNTLTLLKARCLAIQGRSSPDCSLHESDDEQYQIDFFEGVDADSFGDERNDGECAEI
jgi:hypothetical protein